MAGGVNLYSYAGSNPISFSDPFGLSPCPPCLTQQAARPLGPVLGAVATVVSAPVLLAVGVSALVAVAAPGDAHVASSGITAQADATSVVQRKSTRTIRKEWEGLHDSPWPVGVDGSPHQAHHVEPLADGGADDAANIEPLPKADHIQRHKDNGDFKRWGKRRNPESREPESPPEGGEQP